MELSASSQAAVKCVVVGDLEADKCLLLHSALAQMNTAETVDPLLGYNPGVFDNCTVSVATDSDRLIKLSIWDTTGIENYDQLLALIYPETDLFLVCFSLASPTGWRRVLDKWRPELRQHCPGAAIILVGTKLELRDSAMTSSTIMTSSIMETSSSFPAASAATTSSLRRSKQIKSSLGFTSLKRSAPSTSTMTSSQTHTSMVTSLQGQALAEAIGATAYVECSASTRQGVGEVLQQAARAVVSLGLPRRCYGNKQRVNIQSNKCWAWLTIPSRRRAKRKCVKSKLTTIVPNAHCHE